MNSQLTLIILNIQSWRLFKIFWSTDTYNIDSGNSCKWNDWVKYWFLSRVFSKILAFLYRGLEILEFGKITVWQMKYLV